MMINQIFKGTTRQARNQNIMVWCDGCCVQGVYSCGYAPSSMKGDILELWTYGT